MVGRRGSISVSAKSNALDIERRFGGASMGLTRAMQSATARAGDHLIDALERLDNSDGEWIGRPFNTPTGAHFTATPTRDTQVWRETGTRPHPIVAKKKSALRFFWNKRRGVAFFRRVNHPGQRPSPYVERAGRFAERAMFEEFDRAVDKELKGL